MKEFGLGLLTGLGVLTAGASILFHGALGGAAAELPLQLGFLRTLMESYTPLLTPLSSVLGAPSIGGKIFGPLPLLLWLAASAAVALTLREPSKSAKAMFASASVILLAWISFAFALATTWENTPAWLRGIDSMMSDLFITRPLDLLILFTLPPLASATLASAASTLETIEEEPQATEEEYLYA